MRIWSELIAITEAQRGTLLLWMAPGLGVGIGIYFALGFEPGIGLYAPLLGLIVGALALLRWSGANTRRLLVMLALVAGGFILAGTEAHRKAAPVLRGHYYGAVSGRIIAIDRARSGNVRITLDQLWLQPRNRLNTPHKIRITLHYKNPVTTPMIGARVMLTASLSGPSGPTEPQGFDFQRYAWFRGLGAVGYSRVPMLEYAPPDSAGFSMRLARFRMRLARGIRARIDGQAGAFAAAILTGDRSAIAPQMLRFLRGSNLAHLLAISGLHMGLLTGFVFALVRYGLALVPPLALRIAVKKVAAVAAFMAAIAYLMLSGANIATQRAFVMMAVALLAVLLDRRALTLRAVSAAAVIILVLRPESLIEAGFQMSFAATTALVAVFEAAQNLPRRAKERRHPVLRWVLALVASSLVAGLATAPISAFHFNRIAEFGLLANLATVPVMGFVVMPAAVLGILLAPFGLDGVFWSLTGAGIDWILFVARTVSGWDGAVLAISKTAPAVLVLITGGALLVILLRGRVRLIGLAPVLAGFFLWNDGTRPDFLLSANGNLLGVNEGGLRWLNKAKGNGFVAANWLENDGDRATQAEAAARRQINQPVQRFDLGGINVVYDRSKTPDINALCENAVLVILPRAVAAKQRCRVIDKRDIRRMGALAGRVTDGRLSLVGANEVTGIRLWSAPRKRP